LCLVITAIFRDPVTGKYEGVPNGGLLIYYQNRGDGDKGNGGTGLKASVFSTLQVITNWTMLA